LFKNEDKENDTDVSYEIYIPIILGIGIALITGISVKINGP